MLRGIGFLLIVTSAIGVLAPLWSIISNMLGDKWIDRNDLGAYIFSPAFAAFGLAAGVVLVRKKPLKRGALFWMSVFGISVCAPFVATYVAVVLLLLFSGQEGVSLISLVFARVPNDGWWPPQEFLFCNTLMFRSTFSESLFWSGAPLHEPLQFICAPQSSLWFWAYLPLAICLQAIWGQRGKWADKLCSVLAVLLAALLLITVTEIAWSHYQQATYIPDPGSVVESVYQPTLSWYAYYAIVVLWLLAVAVLLVRRKIRPE